MTVFSTLSSKVRVRGSFSGSVVGSAMSGRSTPESFIGLTSNLASTSSAPDLSAVVTFALLSVSSVVMAFGVFVVWFLVGGLNTGRRFFFSVGGCFDGGDTFQYAGAPWLYVFFTFFHFFINSLELFYCFYAMLGRVIRAM